MADDVKQPEEDDLNIDAIVGDVFDVADDGEPQDAEPEPEPAQPVDPYAQVAQQLGMSPDEVREVLEALRASREQPEVAASKLEETAKRIKVQHGIELPDDLREELELGLISEERAVELARARAIEAQWQAMQGQLRVQQTAATLAALEQQLRQEMGQAFDAIAPDLQQFVVQQVAPLVHTGQLAPEAAARMVEADARRLYALYQRVAGASRPKAPKQVVSDGTADEPAKPKDPDAMLREMVERILLSEGDR